MNYLFEDPKYRKVCLKLKKDEYHPFKQIDFTSRATGFDYHIIPYVFGKRDYLKRGITLCVFLTFRKHNRLWACTICNDYSFFVFFSSHFFDRYEERERKDGCVRLELMTDFFRRNHTFSPSPYTHPEHPDSVFVAMDEGIGFGTSEYGRDILVTTYISSDMLYKEQRVIQKEWEEKVIEYYTNQRGKYYSFNNAA